MEVDQKPVTFRILGNCEVCNTWGAKYTCPRCEVKTCSLLCVKVHKKELDCDGVRDRVKFKPIQKLANLDLQNDYMLLEELSRNVALLQKDPLKRYSRRNVALPIHLFKLQKAAVARETSIQFLPQHFTRHQVNSTYLNWKTQELFWRIEWVFTQAEDFTIADAKVLDTLRLASVLEQHLKSIDAKQLFFYQSAGHSGVMLLLKAECIPGQRFYELDSSASVRENLKGKVIVEFPIVHVILKDHKFMYDIIGPDEEEKLAERNKSRRQNKKHSKGKVQNHHNDETGESSNSNFLFSVPDENDANTTSEKSDFQRISYEFEPEKSSLRSYDSEPEKLASPTISYEFDY